MLLANAISSFMQKLNLSVKLIGSARSLAMKREPWHIGIHPTTSAIFMQRTQTDHPNPIQGHDNIFLDTQQVEEGGQWSGSYVGMNWIFTRRGHLETLEGDPRFFFDESRTPQACGTGTEEWGGEGDYWGGQNMSLPFSGHPVGKAAGKESRAAESVNSGYRFLIVDSFPFGIRAVIGLEHGGVNESSEHYSGVVYWYGSPAPSLVLTDTINVCDADDITKHHYQSPTAEIPYQLTSRYDLGPDHELPLWGRVSGAESPATKMYYAAETDTVRVMRGATKFTVRLDANNQGILLRQKFDYQYPNQHAKVYVCSLTSGSWEYAGEWYTAGSNTGVSSRPPGAIFSSAELGATALELVLPALRRVGGEPGLDAAHRRAVPRNDLLWQSQAGPVVGLQPQANPAFDAVDGHRGDLSQAADHQAGRGTQDLSLFAEDCRHRASRPGVATDITYIPLRQGFLYLVAIMDWYSRYVVSWRLSNTLDREFCLEALDEALDHTQPEIFNSDQGSHFTSSAFTSRLEAKGVSISMDGRGRALDNVFVERLWRSVKYEEVYLKDYQSAWEAKDSLAASLNFYCHQRIHQALGYRTPAEVYAERN
jgi:transposase InsO family protein